MNENLKIPDFLSGSCLPTIRIALTQTDEDGYTTPYDASGHTMRCIIAKADTPTKAVLDRECEAADGGFQIDITSEETKDWCGRYACHFALCDAAGLVQRIAYGCFNVIPVPYGGAT